MAVTAKLYGRVFLSAFNKEIDIDSDALKIMLCTSLYTPDQDVHRYKSDVNNEVTGTGYDAGGATLAGVSITYTGGTNVLKIDANDVVWPTSTITARYAVIYDSTPGSDATRPLIGYIDFGENIVSTAGDFTITFDANGIATVTIS